MPVLLTHEQKTDVLVEFTIAGSAAAGTDVTGDIYQYGYKGGSKTEISIPATEVWHLESMHVNGSSVAVDGQIEFYQNGYAQDFKPYASSLLTQSNFSPFTLTETQPQYPTNSVSIHYVTSEANSKTTKQTIKVLFRFVRAPYTG